MSTSENRVDPNFPASPGREDPAVFGARQRWCGNFWAWDLVDFRDVTGAMVRRHYPEADGITFPMIPKQSVHFDFSVLEYCRKAARNNGVRIDVSEGMPSDEFRRLHRILGEVELERARPSGTRTPGETAFNEAFDAAAAKGFSAISKFIKNLPDGGEFEPDVVSVKVAVLATTADVSGPQAEVGDNVVQLSSRRRRM